MNPFKTDVCLKQDELLGEAELINPQDIKIIFLEDCEQRNQPVRRIQLDDRLQKGDNYSKIKESNTFQGVTPLRPQMFLIIYQTCITRQFRK